MRRVVPFSVEPFQQGGYCGICFRIQSVKLCHGQYAKIQNFAAGFLIVNGRGESACFYLFHSVGKGGKEGMFFFCCHLLAGIGSI